MAVSLTTRKSLRWVPGEPYEPTSTLVFDVGDYFVDLRIKKEDGTIDWGMAGRKATLSTDPLKFQWTKEICSMNTEASDDIAVFDILDNGDAFETGSMPNPDNENKVQDFEEVWRSLPTPPNEQPAWVIRKKDESGITYIGRVGDHYQALRKTNEGSFLALREELVKGLWNTQYAIGGNRLPSLSQLGDTAFDARAWSVGGNVDIGGEEYYVLAIEPIS